MEKIGEWSLIELVMKRVNWSSKIDKVVLATSINPKDDVLENHVKQLGFTVTRGSEEDVLSGFYDAAKSFEPTVVVRITGDCPLVSPRLIDHAIDIFIERQADYLSLSTGDDKEMAYPRGFDVEVARFKSLADAAENATKQYEREHVMPYLYTHQELFSVCYLDPVPGFSRPRYRLCVDTRQDLEVILSIHNFLRSGLIETDYREIIEFLDNNPQVVQINQLNRSILLKLGRKCNNKIQNRFGLFNGRKELVKQMLESEHPLRKIKDKIWDCLQDKVILITGGTGFLGKSIASRFLEYEPQSLRIFSRDEVKHFRFNNLFGNNPRRRNSCW